MFGAILIYLTVILLVIFLVSPQKLKFLKKPNRIKVFGLWIATLMIVVTIYAQTQMGKEELRIAEENRRIQDSVIAVEVKQNVRRTDGEFNDWTPQPYKTRYCWTHPFLIPSEESK